MKVKEPTITTFPFYFSTFKISDCARYVFNGRLANDAVLVKMLG